MPFYLHRIGEPIESGLEYATRKEALAERVDGLTVGYIATAADRDAWMARERARFAGGEYLAVPWQYEDFAHTSPCREHYAHLSISEQGLIAYTPSDEYGAENRQLRVKPGKYLTQFSAGQLTQRQIDAYCAQIGNTATGYTVTRDKAEIRSIYRHGPSSCMTKASDAYDLSDRYHPVDAYADSDLALAYLGTTENPTARCLIWPDRKLLTRCYGASNGQQGTHGDVLRALLRKDGYVDAYHGAAAGLMDGARIRAICVDRDRESYLMPYVDAADSASLSDDGKWFILHDHSNGDYSCKRVEGQTADAEPQSTCSNCGSECDEDETYCSSCSDDRWSCENCGHDSFDTSDCVRIGDSYYCSDCASDKRSTCELCDNSWYTVRIYTGGARRDVRFDDDGDRQLTANELQAFKDRHVDHLCSDCAETHDHCATCDDLTAQDDLTDLGNGDCVCADCVPIEAIRTCACDSCRVQS